MKQQQDDDKSDSLDQKSTDSKLDDGSSTGTDENKLTEDTEKGTFNLWMPEAVVSD